MRKRKSKTPPPGPARDRASAPTRFHVGRIVARRILGNLADRTFSRLEAEGVVVAIERGVRGKASVYDLATIVPAYVTHLTGQRPQADREARAARDRTLADLNTLRLRRERGDLVPRSEVVAAGQTFTKTWAAMLRAIPRRIRRAGIIDSVQEADVAAIVREILVEISRWNVAGVEAILDAPVEPAAR